MSSLEKVRPCKSPRFFSQKMEQKLQAHQLLSTASYSKPRQWPGTPPHTLGSTYLPEKKMPSTAAKATSRSAKQLSLQSRPASQCA